MTRKLPSLMEHSALTLVAMVVMAVTFSLTFSYDGDCCCDCYHTDDNSCTAITSKHIEISVVRMLVFFSLLKPGPAQHRNRFVVVELSFRAKDFSLPLNVVD